VCKYFTKQQQPCRNAERVRKSIARIHVRTTVTSGRTYKLVYSVSLSRATAQLSLLNSSAGSTAKTDKLSVSLDSDFAIPCGFKRHRPISREVKDKHKKFMSSTSSFCDYLRAVAVHLKPSAHLTLNKLNVKWKCFFQHLFYFISAVRARWNQISAILIKRFPRQSFYFILVHCRRVEVLKLKKKHKIK